MHQNSPLAPGALEDFNAKESRERATNQVCAVLITAEADKAEYVIDDVAHGIRSVYYQATKIMKAQV